VNVQNARAFYQGRSADAESTLAIFGYEVLLDLLPET
jgi:hypothetical protein